jgi:hypothetical protein
MKKVLVLVAVAALSVPATAAAETQVWHFAEYWVGGCVTLPKSVKSVEVSTRNHSATLDLGETAELGKRFAVTLSRGRLCATLDESADHGRTVTISY